MNDSKGETLEHIKRVNQLLIRCAIEILNRAEYHDDSKLWGVEKRFLDKAQTKLKDISYEEDYLTKIEEAEPEYAEITLQDFLASHYRHNRHHPEHHKRGIEDMNIIDLIEMLCDWKAASERHPGGSYLKSITVNQSRFQYPDYLYSIFRNTGAHMDWINDDPTAS